MSSAPSIHSLSDADLERTLRESRTLADAPEHVIQRAFAVWRPRSHAAPGAEPLRRLLAALSFDSAAASPLAFGMRGSAAAVRQLLYSVEGRDVDLRIAPGEQAATYCVSGQVLGPDCSGMVVIEATSGDERAATMLSDLGEFTLPPVAAGLWRLTLELADAAIELPPLELAVP